MNNSTVITAMGHLDSAKEQLLALQDEPGKTLAKFWKSYDNDGHFKSVEIATTDSEVQKFGAFRKTVLQALYDNLCQPFPCTDVLSTAHALDQQCWPEDKLQRALFGHSDIAFLCKTFQFDSELSADVMLDITMYKL